MKFEKNDVFKIPENISNDKINSITKVGGYTKSRKFSTDERNFKNKDDDNNKSHYDNKKLLYKNINYNSIQILNNLYNNCSILYNTINNLNIQINIIQKNLSDLIQLREKGLQALLNPTNINHYLINYINNNNYNSDYNNFFPLYNLLQTIATSNNFKRKNFKITLKTQSNIPSIEKIQHIKITTNYKNTNINKEIKISESNIINIEDIKAGKEKRTVVRISPIPPNYSSFEISKLLDKYLNIVSGQNQRIYKALFVPLCKVIGKNLGYSFVMLVKPKYVIKFYNTFNGRSFNKKKCKKPCTVVWANLQGDDFLKLSDNPLRSPIKFKDIVID